MTPRRRFASVPRRLRFSKNCGIGPDRMSVTSSYGTNIAFIEELYEKYRIDPTSASASWREFFQGYEPAAEPEEEETEEPAPEPVRLAERRPAVAPAPAAAPIAPVPAAAA